MTQSDRYKLCWRRRRRQSRTKIAIFLMAAVCCAEAAVSAPKRKRQQRSRIARDQLYSSSPATREPVSPIFWTAISLLSLRACAFVGSRNKPTTKVVLAAASAAGKVLATSQASRSRLATNRSYNHIAQVQQKKATRREDRQKQIESVIRARARAKSDVTRRLLWCGSGDTLAFGRALEQRMATREQLGLTRKTCPVK